MSKLDSWYTNHLLASIYRNLIMVASVMLVACGFAGVLPQYKAILIISGMLLLAMTVYYSLMGLMNLIIGDLRNKKEKKIEQTR